MSRMTASEEWNSQVSAAPMRKARNGSRPTAASTWWNSVAVAQGCRGLLDEGERQQHEPEADEDAAHVVRAELGRPGMDDIAREEQDGRGPEREVGARGEDGGDDGRAHIRAQQHGEAQCGVDGARRGEARHDQRHRRAGAEDGGGDTARHEGRDAVADAVLDEVLEAVAPGPHHAGAHHAHAPEQEGDARPAG